jgi:hypothetical protein
VAHQGLADVTWTNFALDQNASSGFQEQHVSECVKRDALIRDRAKHD